MKSLKRYARYAGALRIIGRHGPETLDGVLHTLGKAALRAEERIAKWKTLVDETIRR